MESLNEQPNYYAIIPAPVRYCKNLSANEKLLFGELSALTWKEGFCWASNEHFAHLYDVNKRTIQVWLDNLEKEGFIRRLVFQTDKKTVRKIYTAKFEISWGKGVKKNTRGDVKNNTQIEQDSNNTQDQHLE